MADEVDSEDYEADYTKDSFAAVVIAFGEDGGGATFSMTARVGESGSGDAFIQTDDHMHDVSGRILSEIAAWSMQATIIEDEPAMEMWLFAEKEEVADLPEYARNMVDAARRKKEGVAMIIAASDGGGYSVIDPDKASVLLPENDSVH